MIIGRLFLFTLLFYACAASAVQCEVISAPRVAAKPLGENVTEIAQCQLGGIDALHLKGRIGSTLVRARGYVGAEFFDASGRRIGVVRRGPWLGTFSGLLLDELIPVPGMATRVRLFAAAQSVRADAGGEWRLEGVSAVRGIVAKLEAADGKVLEAGRQSSWIVETTAGSPAGKLDLAVVDLDGRELFAGAAPIVAGGARVTVEVPELPVGFHDVVAAVNFGAAIEPTILRSSIVVFPAGIAPNERRIGMDAALSWYGGTSAMIAQSLELMQLAGVGTVRDRMSWSRALPAPGRANWGRYAEVADAVRGAGMESVQVFHDSPAWARGGQQGPADRQAPTDDAAVYWFGRAYAQGLGRTVRSVEYWNEQNSDFFRGYPFQYASQLKAFYAGVKSVDPDIRVLIGAAAGQPGRFFQETYLNGVANFFDVRNQHYYGKDAALARFVAEHVAGIERLGTVADRAGWLTEMGYSLQRDSRGDWRKAEIEQGEYLVKTYASGFAAGYERVFFFFWGHLVEAELHTWGLLHEDLSPRPAYLALGLLSRHLAGAQLVGVEAGAKGQAVYFRRADGDYLAVMWGGRDPAELGGAVAATDAFGRAIDGEWSRSHPDSPILVSGIPSLPSTASVPAAPAARRATTAQLRISAKVLVGGSVPGPLRENRVSIPVRDGDVVTIAGRLYSENRGERDLVRVICSGGAGMTVLSPETVAIDRVPEDGAEFQCRFAAGLSRVGESHISAKAVQGFRSDVVRVALIPDASSVHATYRAIPSARECPVWVGRASRNVELAVDSGRSAGSGCAPVNVVSRVRTAGETWVFPALPVDGSSMNTAKGLRASIGALGGSSMPPTAMLLQLVERSGGVWLIDLSRDATGGQMLTGLFNLARPAPWARDDNGQLDLRNVKELMLGWGGYGGQTGQRYGFSIESMELLVDD